MEVLEAIKTRRSIRAYKPDPVPRQAIEKILDACRYAPSWGNTQCWEIAVLAGAPLAELKRGIEQRILAGVPDAPHLSRPGFTPKETGRSGDVLEMMQQAQGIKREDKEKRLQWRATMGRFFDAPAGIILYMEKYLGLTVLMDIGAMMQTIALAAHASGLGTCPEAVVVRYPDLVHQVVGIPESKLLAVGLSLGYPDTNNPVNKFDRPRLPLDSFVLWRGL
ncbi:MAG: nitroreductase [Dehalococcoidia bacterium]|nr:nitroreductase [Dehalococcoidia bacterium]